MLYINVKCYINLKKRILHYRLPSYLVIITNNKHMVQMRTHDTMLEVTR